MQEENESPIKVTSMLPQRKRRAFSSLLLLLASLGFAQGPIFHHPDAANRIEYLNIYNELDNFPVANLDRTGQAGQAVISQGSSSAPKWAATGLVLQSTMTSFSPSFSTSNTSFVDTGVQVTITPKFSNSLMRIYATGVIGNNTQAQNTLATLVRGSTNLLDAANGGCQEFVDAVTTNGFRHNCTMIYNDQPNSTSAVTYKIQIKSSSGAAIAIWGNNVNSTLIVDEIGQ